MTNATDNAVASYFSNEAESIKKRSWTSLWIGLGFGISSVLLIIPLVIVLLIKPILGMFLFGLIVILTFTALFFFIRFGYFRMKLAKCVGDNVRAQQQC